MISSEVNQPTLEYELIRNKRKHVTLTIQEKLEVINLVETGSSRQNIAKHFSIGKSTVHDIYKRKDAIQNFALQNSNENLSKRRRVDIKTEIKSEDQYRDDTIGIVEEETLVEDFDHEEFDYNDDDGYEIVYEPILCNTNEIDTKPPQILSSSNELNTSDSKRKSKTLTLREKYEILLQLEDGKSVSSIITKYGIGRTTLYDLKKQKQKIIQYMVNSNGESRRTFKKSNYPQIEENLLVWCNERDYFTEQQFFEKYKELFMLEKTRNPSFANSSTFTGSWSWCKRFFDRNPEYKRRLITSKTPNDSFKSNIKSSSLIVEGFVNEKPQGIEDLTSPPFSVDLKKVEDQDQDKSNLSEIIDDDEDVQSSIDNIHDESMEYLDADYMSGFADTKNNNHKLENDSYSNDYIVEELDPNFQDEKDKDDYIVDDEDAMSSLKTLIRYAQQRGHEEIAGRLIEYRNILIEEENL